MSRKIPQSISLGRLPGEIAFDRCFLPLAALASMSVVLGIFASLLRPFKRLSEGHLAAERLPALGPWVLFALGLLLTVLWLRAIVSLVRAWHDPSSKVLRFSASVLLFPFAFVTGQLLLAPFR